MAKVAMLCPFSHKMCRDCAVYRGSHYYLCFKKEYRGRLLDKTGKRTRKAKTNSVYGKTDLSCEIPEEILSSPAVINDVEDIIEKEEFGKFKERRDA